MSSEAATTAESTWGCSRTAGNHRAKILCIDRDLSVADAMEERMRDVPVDVLRAGNGMQGIWLAISKHPALIITDSHMTNGHGGEILQSLHENRQTRDVPVIVLASHDYPGWQKHVHRMGATHCFGRPIDIDALLERVCELLSIRREAIENIPV